MSEQKQGTQGTQGGRYWDPRGSNPHHGEVWPVRRAAAIPEFIIRCGGSAVYPLYAYHIDPLLFAFWDPYLPPERQPGLYRFESAGEAEDAIARHRGFRLPGPPSADPYLVVIAL